MKDKTESKQIFKFIIKYKKSNPLQKNDKIKS